MVFGPEDHGAFAYVCGSCATLLAFPANAEQMHELDRIKNVPIQKARQVVESVYGAANIAVIDEFVKSHFIDHWGGAKNFLLLYKRP